MHLIPVGQLGDIVLYSGGGREWIDADTIGRLLYPGAKDPAKRVRNIHSRNKKHFSAADTMLLKVNTTHLVPHSEAPGPLKEVSQKREVRFFSLPRGVAKICNLSRSGPSTKVLDGLFDLQEAFLKGSLPQPAPDPSLAALAQIPKWAPGKGRMRQELARHEGVTDMTIRRRENKLLSGEPLQKVKESYVHKKHRDLQPQALELREHGLRGLEIGLRLGVPYQTVYRWLKKSPLP